MNKPVNNTVHVGQLNHIQADQINHMFKLASSSLSITKNKLCVFTCVGYCSLEKDCVTNDGRSSSDERYRGRQDVCLLKLLSVLEMIYEKTQEVGNVKGMLRIMDTAGSVGLLMDI